MSNDLSIFDRSAAPDYLAKYIKQAEQVAAMATGFASVPSISIKGKQFRYTTPEGKEVVVDLGVSLECIILAFDPLKGTAKTFYGSGYTSESTDAPDCFSVDGIRPSNFVTTPYAKSCDLCPNNQWGSAKDAAGAPTKGRACADVKNLYVVPGDNVEGPVYVLRVPPTSLKGLSTYARLLSSKHTPHQVVVTKVGFEDSEHPQLTFDALKFLGAAEADAAVTRAESAEVRAILPSNSDVAPATEDAPAALPAPVPAPVPAVSLPPVPVAVMTAAATGTYEDYMGAGWTDQQLIEHGLMEVK